MEKLNVHSFYTFGAAVKDQYGIVKDEQRPMMERTIGLFQLKTWFGIFLERSSDTSWRSSRERAKQVIALLDQRVGGDVRDRFDANAPFGWPFLRELNNLIPAFEMTFASESLDSNVFSVSQKGTHSTLDLMERAEENLSPDVRSRLSAEATEDIRQAGRCLALDCHTATGYHIFRAVERVIIKYLEKVSGKPLSPKNRNWGVYIRELNRLNADSSVTGYLDHVRKFYRNPVVHPEATLNSNEAFGLFNASLSAITQLDAAIEAWP